MSAEHQILERQGRRTAAAIEREKQDDREKARRQADSDFRELMSRDWGRRLVWHLLDQTDGSGATFATNHTVCVKNATLRDFGKREFTDRATDLCVEDYLRMRKEHKQ